MKTMTDHVLKKTIVSVSVYRTAIAVILALPFYFSAEVSASESTAHVDLRVAFEEHWEEMYRNPVVLEVLAAHIANVSNSDEQRDVSRWIERFITRGFESGEMSKYRLFRANNAEVRKRFLEIVQGSPYRLSPKFLVGIYKLYQSAPARYDFEALREPAWIEFSKAIADDDTYSALEKLFERQGGPGGDLENYFQVLYYGYGVFPKNESRLDKEILNRPLAAKTLTHRKIAKIYQILQGASYWNSMRAKRQWMLVESAKRLYNDFTPEQWSELPPEIVLNMARLLSQSPAAERRPVSLKDWIKKIGAGIKRNPTSVALRSLLVLFLTKSGVELKESFALLRPQFEDDQKMFVALHESPPQKSPMDVWHGDASNLMQSTQILEKLFKRDRADQWDQSLWACLKEHYYSKHSSLQNQLFKSIIFPLAKDKKLAAHPIRSRLLMQETSSAKSFLLDSHRYEISHHFLSTRPMTDPVISAAGGDDVLTFAVRVYKSLNYREAELYGAPSIHQELKRRKYETPSSPPDRITAYLNCVIGEPLELMCWAFQKRTQETRNVTFSLSDKADMNRVEQFESLLHRIIEVKNVLRSEHGVELKRIKILDEIVEDIVKTMEKAIADKRSDLVVDMVRLTLMITVILEDDTYINKALDVLRDSVFEIPEDGSLFRQVSKAKLDRMVKLFEQLHSENLVDAIREFHKMKYVEMFYDRLYVPLRGVYGFFNRVGAKPYVLFVNEFGGAGYDRSADLNRRWEMELKSLGDIHGESGNDDPRYINAEAAVVELLRAYCSKMSLNLWHDSRQLVLSRNVNLSVFQLLLAENSDGWRLADLEPAKQADCYRNIAKTFLDNLNDDSLLDRPYPLDDAAEKLHRRHFFHFLNNLVELYEIHGFPLGDLAPSQLYSGSPMNTIERRVLSGDMSFAARKVDGDLRAKFFGVFNADSKTDDPPDDKHREELFDLLLLLPNKPENNHGPPGALDEYRKLKSEAFLHISTLLDQASSSSQRLKWLTALCRLEASLFTLQKTKGGSQLAGGEPLGYKEKRNQFFTMGSDVLDYIDRKQLVFEEFRLIQVNQPSTDSGRNGTTIVQLAEMIEEVKNSICQAYEIPREIQKLDSFSRAIVSLYRETEPEKMLESLRKEHVAEFWFMTTKCQELLRKAASKGKDELSEEEKRAVVSVASSLLFLHSYFMPYVHGKFEMSVLFEKKFESSLFLFCTMDRRVKRPLVDLLTAISENDWNRLGTDIEKDSSMPPARFWEMKAFLISHNFLPLQLLDISLDDSQRFERLVRGQEVEITTYNFTLLWRREDRGRISLESLCDEVFDGVECNRDLLACGRKLSDDDYLQYYFGDMRKIIGTGTQFSEQMPQNYDQVVRKFAVLPDDPRVKTLKSRLKAMQKEQSQGTADMVAESNKRELQQRIATALKGLDGLQMNITTVLSRGHEYFGHVLAEKFESPYTIQKACETAGARIAVGPASQFSKAARERYARFYESALFDSSGFRKELSKNIVDKFYSRPDAKETPVAYRARKRRELQELIDGRKKNETEGFIATAKKPSSERTRFDKRYVSAARGLLRSLVAGDGLASGQPFIGDVLWEIGENGRPRPKLLDYTNRPDDIHEFLMWIYDGIQKYRGVDEIRSLFGNAPSSTGISETVDRASNRNTTIEESTTEKR